MKDVILDIDSVGDDMLAVLYAAMNPKLNLLGVTTVNGACGSIEQAVEVALYIVSLTDKNIPVFAGASTMLNPLGAKIDGDPVNFEKELQWKFGKRLERFNEKLPKVGNKQEIKAEEYIIEMAHQRAGKLNIVTTGPITNLALALKKDPSIAEKIEHAYILGGTFHSPGNITPVVEYNIWADPEAAQIVFRSGIKSTLVPLDVCENNDFADGMLTRDHLSDLQYGNPGKISNFIIDKFPIYIDIWREYFQLAGFPMDDVITAALAIDENFCEYTEPVFVDVELEGKMTRGQTIAYFGHQIVKNPLAENKNLRIAKKVYGKRFMNDFIGTLTGH